MLSVQKDAKWFESSTNYRLISEKYGVLAEAVFCKEGVYTARVIPNIKFHIYSPSLEEIKEKVSKFLLRRDKVTVFLNSPGCTEATEVENGITYEERRTLERHQKRVARQTGKRRGRGKSLPD